MTASPSRKVYFDHSATTRVLPEVAEAMKPFFTEKFGNPSTIHSWGREARAAMEDARKKGVMASATSGRTLVVALWSK